LAEPSAKASAILVLQDTLGGGVHKADSQNRMHYWFDQGLLLARIIHERFFCNRRSAALTREASLGRGVAGFWFQVSSSNSEYQ
jgi:hypothetical protein